MTRRNLRQEDKNHRITSLSTKFRRSDICVNRVVINIQEAIRVKKAWLLVCMVTGIAHTATTMLGNRKQLHKRVENSLAWIF